MTNVLAEAEKSIKIAVCPKNSSYKLQYIEIQNKLLQYVVI